MYKTVRHGENSLQYTILPQTEEVLNNSGLKGKGRDYSPSIHVRRSRRRSTVKYVLLILFGVIIALVLAAVPLYVMNGTLLSSRILPDHHEVGTTAPIAPAGREIAKSRKKELKISSEIFTMPETKSDTSTTTATPSTTFTVSATITSERSTPPWTMPALRSWKSSTMSPTVKPIPTEETKDQGTLPNSNHMVTQDTSEKSWERDIIIRPAITPEPMTLRNIMKYYTQSYAPTEKTTTSSTKKFDDVLITTRRNPTGSPSAKEFTTASDSSKLRDLEDTILSVENDEEYKGSLEVDEVFSLPPLKPDFAAPDFENDEVTVSKTGEGGWYGARWPFVDTLSHFQWTDYSPGDNLLLPLLIAALTSVALVVLLALAVRRRKRTQELAAIIGKAAADDNTKLLTAENAEDGEE